MSWETGDFRSHTKACKKKQVKIRTFIGTGISSYRIANWRTRNSLLLRVLQREQKRNSHGEKTSRRNWRKSESYPRWQTFCWRGTSEWQSRLWTLWLTPLQHQLSVQTQWTVQQDSKSSLHLLDGLCCLWPSTWNQTISHYFGCIDRTQSIHQKSDWSKKSRKWEETQRHVHADVSTMRRLPPLLGPYAWLYSSNLSGLHSVYPCDMGACISTWILASASVVTWEPLSHLANQTSHQPECKPGKVEKHLETPHLCHTSLPKDFWSLQLLGNSQRLHVECTACCFWVHPCRWLFATMQSAWSLKRQLTKWW